MYDVIVIGAGAAGLSAAVRLAEAERKILVLEANATAGGRIRNIDTFPGPAAAGAEFIHGKLPLTFSFLKKYQLGHSRLQGSFARFESGLWSSDNDLFSEWQGISEKMMREMQDITVTDFLLKHYPGRKYQHLRKQFTNYVEGYDVADPMKANIFAIRYEMQHEDERQYRPSPNYNALIKKMSGHIQALGGTIHLSECVTDIRMDQRVIIETVRTNYVAEKIIVALPLGILQLKRGQSGRVEFPVICKEHISAARRIGVGGVIKFLLEFDTAFWLERSFLKVRELKPPSYIFSDAAVPTWWTQYPDRRPLLTGWVGGPKASKLRDRSDKYLLSLATKSLAHIFQLSSDQIGDRLQKHEIINWLEEPFIRTGYSYSTLQTEKAREILSRPAQRRIFFAGEYVPSHSTSTVDAAFQSGIDAAQAVLK